MLRAYAACKLFDKDFARFERNRMYPLGYRKESAMRMLNLKDVSAISHAETYFFGAFRTNTEARLRREIEDDLVRLADIKRWMLKAIYEPGLPISAEIPEVPKPIGTQTPDMRKHDGNET